jgi:phage terminase large subunit-like protein
MSSAEQYASWVLDPSNAQRTGQYIKLAAKRFLSDLTRDDIYFDEVEANRICLFAERYCCLWEDKWRGVPVKLEPWQKFALQNIYGWFWTETKLRRFNIGYIQIAKKNAKTTLGGGVVGNFHLFADERIKTPKIFVGANNEEQAKICVNITGKVIEQSPALYRFVEDGEVRLFRYKENIINIVHEERDGFIKALSKETGDRTSKTAGGKHGINPSLGIIDEYGMAQDDNLMTTIQSAQAGREEPFVLIITTSGYYLEGPCYQKLRKTGIGVLERTMTDDTYFVLIYEIDKPEGSDITIDWLLANEQVWEQANPNIDVSVFRHFLRRELIAAKNEGGSKEVSVMTLNFNRWMEAAEVFISVDVWNKNTHSLHVEPSEECYGGLEVAPSGKLSAFALLFPGEIVKIKMLFFLAEDALKFHEFYRDNKDFIKVDPGNVVDNEVAIKWIIEEIQKCSMNSFCFAKPQENNSIVQGLIKEGYTGNPISQGLSGIANATDEWEKLLRAGQIEHFGNPILRYQNSNCMAVRKEAGTRIEKNPKVLGIWACLNAVSQWKTIEAEGGTSIGIVYI